MKPVWMYLDEAQERGIAVNDTDIAAKLGVTKASVCEWRKGRSAPGEDAAAKLAALLEKPEVMAECAAARAKTPEGRRMWERLARIAAAAVVMAAAIPTHENHRVVKTRCNYSSLLFSEVLMRLLRAPLRVCQYALEEFFSTTVKSIMLRSNTDRYRSTGTAGNMPRPY